MSRIVKFRAWDGNQMIQSPLAIWLDGTADIFKRNDEGYLEPYRRFNGSIMQFTGLLDKNGKEIYEGDVVRYMDTKVVSNESGTEYDDIPNRGTIYWDEDSARWNVTNRDYIGIDDFLDMVLDDVEVIGDIYRTPELLK